VVDTSEITHCVGCGDELAPERIEHGYTYCLKDDCQARYRRGLTITTVGVNKGADTVIVGDEDEVRRRGETGELARKDTSLGLDYGSVRAGRTGTTPPPTPPPTPQRRAPRRPWTPQQEQLVRLYHDMGLSPRAIVERARRNNPRLGITERLVVQILSAPPSRR
jgi:hypothetical protein